MKKIVYTIDEERIPLRIDRYNWENNDKLLVLNYFDKETGQIAPFFIIDRALTGEYIIKNYSEHIGLLETLKEYDLISEERKVPGILGAAVKLNESRLEEFLE